MATNLARNLKNHAFLSAFFAACLLILPGVAFFFLFSKESVFDSLEWVKLIILSASLIMPFAILNTMAAMNFYKVKPGDGGALFYYFSSGVMMSGMGLYLAMLIVWFTDFIGIRAFGTSSATRVAVIYFLINMAFICFDFFESRKVSKLKK